MSIAPFMNFYVGDYLADTTHLTTVEHGAYLLLLFSMWRAGGKLPRDDRKLARIAKLTDAEWLEVQGNILPFFRIRGGTITQKRLTEEAAKYRNTLVQRSKAGKASALKKRNEINENTSTRVEHMNHKPEPEPYSISVSNETGETASRRASSADVETPRQAQGSDPNKESWERAGKLLPKPTDRAFFGRLLKDFKLEARDLLPSIVACELRQTLDPKSYLRQAAAAVAQRRGVVEVSDADRVATWDDDHWRSALEIYRERGSWHDAWGPKPGDPGCRVPAQLLLEAVA